MRRVFGFGETVLDIIFKNGQPVAAKPGGSVLNTFVSLGRLGWKPSFISEYATDDVGCLTETFLRDNGVDTRYVNRFSGGQSALAIAFLDDDNNASYTFYRDFPEERLQELPEDLSAEDIILFGSIYASNAEVRNSVLRFLEMGMSKGCLIFYDPNFRKSHLNELDELKPRIIENIACADIIRGSDDDFHLIFGKTDVESAREVIPAGGKLLHYTRNTDGVKVLFGEESLDVPAEKITPVSTIGAGDNFNAGLIHYLLAHNIRRADLVNLQQADLIEMAETGVKFASHVCMHYDNYISREFAEELAKK